MSAACSTSALAELPASFRPDERTTRGRALNTRQALGLGETPLSAARERLARAEARATAGLDVTLPGRRPWVGRPHVLARVADGDARPVPRARLLRSTPAPRSRRDEYNFGKLNFPHDHPARDAHDTYWIEPSAVLLRTHTSPGWVRAMEERKPPLRLVFPGRVYRAEQVDASHMDQFHQIDGLFVDRNVSMADLKAHARTRSRALDLRAEREDPADAGLLPVRRAGLPARRRVRDLRRHADGVAERAVARCARARAGASCWAPAWCTRTCSAAVGYDPEEVTGFAFGMGLERIAMARYGMPEIRLFLENDMRFLSQF